MTKAQHDQLIQQWAERVADYLLGLDQDRSHRVLTTREHKLSQSGASIRSKVK